MFSFTGLTKALQPESEDNKVRLMALVFDNKRMWPALVRGSRRGAAPIEWLVVFFWQEEPSSAPTTASGYAGRGEGGCVH